MAESQEQSPPPSVQEAAEQAAHAPSSNLAASTSLPPEAIAFAGRLFEATRKGDESSMDLIRAAVDHGLNPDLTNDKGDGLVMLAAYHGHVAILRLLLEKGADPNRLNDRGQSPLAGVVFKNEKECVLALLEAGADPELGEPSAMDSCKVFKQEEFEAMFQEQVEQLKTTGGRAVNGNS